MNVIKYEDLDLNAETIVRKRRVLYGTTEIVKGEVVDLLFLTLKNNNTSETRKILVTTPCKTPKEPINIFIHGVREVLNYYKSSPNTINRDIIDYLESLMSLVLYVRSGE